MKIFIAVVEVEVVRRLADHRALRGDEPRHHAAVEQW
jgi:hypothetical protein